MDANDGFAPEIVALRRTVRDFADREVRPRVKDMEAQEQISEELIGLMGEVGFFGVALPEKSGGAGLGELGMVVTLEELSRAHVSTALLLTASSGLAGRIINVHGSDEQQRSYLRQLASGELIGSFCLTEPSAGSDVSALSTTAHLDGDDYVLSGQKTYVTNGDRAGIYLIFAKLEPGRGRDGIALFIVERKARGLSVVRVEDKMGLRASGTAQIALDDVRVTKNQLVGEADEGFRIALGTLNGSRVGIGAMCLGVAKEALELGWQYAHERELFGQTVGDFQVTQHAFADMEVEIFAIESMVYRTARRLSNGDDVAAEASICKIFATEAAQRIVDRSLQMHGGAGYLKDSAIERLYRDIRVARIYEGANEVQRNNVYRVMKRQRQ
uniref:Acyl-CoA dehydrogenases n=1 Tax=uncultured Chloroflexi bacterium HF0200_09I09 TaxID=710736 RepID=E0XU96_9CHLR|nr:acyl-CoA dehydrogenases [uncultured Chloroflexi bacterium HF0200_09I09]